MSYYISTDGKTSPARVVKRLGDFKGKEGEKYTVRTRRKVELLDLLPTYEFTNGKLRKLSSFGCLWGAF